MSEKEDKQADGEKAPILPKYYKAEMSEDSSAKQSRGNNLCFILSILAILLVLVALIAIGVGLGVGYGLSSSKPLSDYVKTDQLRSLLQGLQDTAVNNSRSILTGFNNSFDYVNATLTQHGYTTTKLCFTIPVPEDNEGLFSATVNLGGDGPITVNYPQSNQFQIMIYSAGCTTDCTFTLVSLMDDEDSEFGCDIMRTDVDNAALLIPYESAVGNCSVYEKAVSAKEAGAAAVIFVRTNISEPEFLNPPRTRVFDRVEGSVYYVDILSIGVTNATGEQLVNFLNIDSSMQVTLELSASVVNATTCNLFAETEEGKEDSIVMTGSHLDSVPAGPGINDDGSGSMLNLDLAIQIAEQKFKPKNKVRFAWWGAEELGLLGSRFYVYQLTEKQKDDISVYLNFDMVASPNYQRGVYGAKSAEDNDILGPLTVIQDLFITYFNNTKQTYELVPFTGGSDYRPFLDVGIPSGGLFTGAGSIKTERQWELFGGIRNTALDTCYHQACDTISNIDFDVYREMTKSAAYVIQKLMEQDDLEGFLG